MPDRANNPAYWHQQQQPYSRSTSTASVDSVYPSSSVGNDADVDDDDECWSDTLEDFGQNLPFGQTRFGQMPQFLKPNVEGADDDDDDLEKTPVTSKRFNESDLYRVAQKLEQIPAQEIVAYPAAVVREKSPPAVSMASARPRSDIERSSSRASMTSLTSVKKSRAPDPPMIRQDLVHQQQQQPQQLDVDPIEPRQLQPMTSFPVSLTGGLPVKRLSRPIPAGSGSAAAVTEARPSMAFPINKDKPENPFEMSPGLPDLPPIGSVRPRQPSFSYPVAKNPAGKVSDPSPTRSVIEEKRPFLQQPTTSRPETGDPRPRRIDSPQPMMMRSLSPNVAADASSSSTLSTSPTTSRCPHCKIHSWLPHSAGCPNKKS